ncbi:MAG: iron-containing redox enzyme family protein [Acidobacteriales bacterium]|nr:iron-containing redox enzyme family protein [Terriglobales bacterium]
MTSNEFLQELDTRIAKYDLLCHPFYKAWSAGELTPEDLHEYARDYYPHVKAFPEYLLKFSARLEDGSLRKAVRANMNDELGKNGGRAHSELWLDFVEGMGGSRDAEKKPIREIEELVAFFDEMAGFGLPEEALAAFYAYESQVPRVAGAKAQGLREMYGANEATCAYFALHTTADVLHSQVWRRRLAELVQDHRKAQEAALASAENAAKALWRALDGVEQLRMARAAA